MRNPESIESLVFTKGWAFFEISTRALDVPGRPSTCPYGDQTSDCILKESETREFAIKGSWLVKLNVGTAL
jgi:hypothetical protein